MSLSKFIDRKLKTVAALHAGQCDGSYVEACILLAALLSAMAADLWPGKRGMDRKRFVELWVRYGRTVPGANLVSVPLLTRWLRQRNRVDEAETIEGTRLEMFGPGYTALVVTGSDVDMTEAELRKVCPAITKKEARSHAYAPVFYEHVRSALVHEYRCGDDASDWPMTARNVGVSYVNMLDRPHAHVRRPIHFHVPWLMELVRAIAVEVEKSPRTLSSATTWWLAGG